jgi:hypothetical protein
MNDTIFVDGLGVYQNDKDFVVCDISIEPKKLIAFLQANKEHMSEKGYFRISVLKSKNKEGVIYAKLDTWKPTEKVADSQENTDDSIDPSSIPF